jgi:hypothetical protein
MLLAEVLDIYQGIFIATMLQKFGHSLNQKVRWETAHIVCGGFSCRHGEAEGKPFFRAQKEPLCWFAEFNTDYYFDGLRFQCSPSGMGLYGLSLHLPCSFTGGFMLHCNDKWPNIIKCSTFGILFLDLRLILPLFVRVLTGLMFAVMVLIIWLNSLLDDSVSVDADDNWIEEREAPSIPPGISGPLWDARSVLFEERTPLDNRVYRLVRPGFDVDQAFRLIEVIHQGAVTRETLSGA